MRNRGILRILPALGVGVLLLPLAWANTGRQGDSEATEAAVAALPASAVAPPGSLPGSVEEDRLWAEARQDSAAAVVTRRAERAAQREAAKRAAAERARRQRASRSGARSQPPLVIAGAADDVWAKLRRCEAGGDYRRNSGNGYYGAYQFAAATWRSLGYSGLPHRASPEVQDQAARKLQRRSGWGQWPACSRRIGVR